MGHNFAAVSGGGLLGMERKMVEAAGVEPASETTVS